MDNWTNDQRQHDPTGTYIWDNELITGGAIYKPR